MTAAWPAAISTSHKPISLLKDICVRFLQARSPAGSTALVYLATPVLCAYLRSRFDSYTVFNTLGRIWRTSANPSSNETVIDRCPLPESRLPIKFSQRGSLTSLETKGPNSEVAVFAQLGSSS